MAIFYSTIPNLSTFTQVDGVKYRIKFIPRSKPYNNGILATSDKDLIAAIRKHPYFGTVFTELKEDIPAPAEEKKEYSAIYEDVTKSQEARELLVNKYGVNADTLKNKAAIKQAAEELNILFPNL
jgi:hypothetical protein